jgi:glycosyltransferase involved in cell wall biosynthesis
LIIADDGSTDGTEKYIKSLINKGLKIRYFRNPNNEGQLVNQQKFISEAKGDLITILQSDDYYLSEKFISESVRQFQIDKNLAMSWCAAKMSYYGTRRHSFMGGNHPMIFKNAVEATRHLISYGCWPSTMMARMDAFKRVGGFRADIGVGTDLFCAAALTKQGSCAYSPVAHINARVHRRSFTGIRGWRRLYEELKPTVKRISSELFQDEENFSSVLQDLITVDDSKKLVKYNKGFLSRRVNKLFLEKRSEKDLIIYGAGKHTEKLFEWTEIKRVPIKGLIDSNTSLKGRSFCGQKIFCPSELSRLLVDHPKSVVLISSCSFQNQIHSELLDMGVTPEKIVTLY